MLEEVHRLNERLSVRLATPSDLPRIAEIWLEGITAAFPEGFPEQLSRESIDAQLLKMVEAQTRNFKFWLCFANDDSVLGWSTVQPFSTTPLESARNMYGFISTYISASARGQGVGRALLEFVLYYCKHHTDILYVLGIQAKSNGPSIAVAERVGFVELGTFPPLRGTVPTAMIVCATGEESR